MSLLPGRILVSMLAERSKAGFGGGAHLQKNRIHGKTPLPAESADRPAPASNIS
ncbi:hypothetical protein [Massilia sp. LXY-6]|uniref:hypothetical protein n=1 Tax=Massilia sp. LXY-6 TaxID=3379823 RepID=UPI003F49CD48